MITGIEYSKEDLAALKYIKRAVDRIYIELAKYKVLQESLTFEGMDAPTVKLSRNGYPLGQADKYLPIDMVYDDYEIPTYSELFDIIYSNRPLFDGFSFNTYKGIIYIYTLEDYR